ncbi:hypothetical protein ACH42_00065 [Endozoicomonas sp. (ex Bugula neritina AB1)]|nr:hypothetical protein ACH42_00065 [Endozoicomonas sp. (ex Bugula neritina AB1)]
MTPVRRASVVVVPLRRLVVVTRVHRQPTYYAEGVLAAFTACLIISDIIDDGQVQPSDMMIVYVNGKRYYQYETNFFIKGQS